MSRLKQLLAYLQRDGVTELVLGSGRPIAVRVDGAYQQLTPAVLNTTQLFDLVRGSALEAQLPTADTNGQPVVLSVADMQLKVHAARRSDAVIMKIELAEPRQASSAPPAIAASPAPVAPPARQATQQGHVATRPTSSPHGERGPEMERTSERSERGPSAIAAAIDLEIGGDSHFELDAPAVQTPPRSSSAAAHVEPPVSRTTAVPAPAPGAIPVQTVVAVAAEPAFRIDDAPPPPPPAAFVKLIEQARARNASDLHIAAGRPVMVRAIGDLVPVGEVLSAQAAQSLLEPLLSGPNLEALRKRGYADFAIDVPNLGRLRANIGKQREGYKGSFRLVTKDVPTLESLGLPKDLAKVTSYHQGLVVIAGPNGHGKTTTLAALVDLINSTKPHHILTVEDPVEVFHPRKMAMVSQREIGRNTKSFVTALKASLREDPDVIVIGELRDRETVEIALTAAETGHLVMATMSTPSAGKTIDRLIDMFPPEDQSQVRVSLAGALRFIVAQRLMPNVNNDGVVPAVELLTGVLPVAALIRDNKLFQLPSVQQRGRAFGMIRFDDSIIELAKAGVISEETALRTADSRKDVIAAINPAAAASAAAAIAAASAPPQGKGLDSIKSKFGGIFGKKDKE